ncbi:GNAT family N-acetyltransferase [Streptomyces sp. NBC_01304]|uniref:GNAT family N-acetyltransferase n=1 Tax=Streptomyces sp. NBC_01304 TaxID=2903818 RepID=UPI002E11FF80|nr:GNAT family N-acetyltransferase [Streptomyces sp. NBC_01304]
MDYVIRQADPEEFPALGDLTVQAYLDDCLFPGPDYPYVMVLRDVAARAEGAETLVAVDEAGSLLGGVAFALAGSVQAQVSEPGEAEFRALAVAKAGRGRGVGAALVEACVQRARDAGCSGVRLSTAPDMRAAHRLYARLGFVRTPERDWSPVSDVTLLTYLLSL